MQGEFINYIKYWLKFIPDKIYLQIYYFAKFKRFVDFKHPKTFNEKLQWLKVNDHNPKYVRMVDKYEAKQYVSEILNESFVIPTYGVWRSFDDIDFDFLPNQFVLKCTHDCGGLVICKDKNKLDIEDAKRKISKALKNDYFYVGREWPYKKVFPRIIAEQYMENDSDSDLMDYKVHCFNGKPKLILVCSQRYSKYGLCEDWYDLEWNYLNMGRPNQQKSTIDIPKPENLNEMIEAAERLSYNMPFCRVDFYIVKGKLYFGELTLYPASGFGLFEPKKWDLDMGNWIDLSKIKGGTVAKE